MMPRTAVVTRRTRETAIRVRLAADCPNRPCARTGIGFFDHMLEAMALHGGFGLDLTCTGDLHVDQHHTVEDCGLVLGQAWDRVLATRRGLVRAGYFLMPMDEALALAAVDFSGRPRAEARLRVRARRVGGLETELVTDFLEGLALGARATIHLRTVAGRSSHHTLEAAFKALGRALYAASRHGAHPSRIPSTKGLL